MRTCFAMGEGGRMCVEKQVCVWQREGRKRIDRDRERVWRRIIRSFFIIGGGGIQ